MTPQELKTKREALGMSQEQLAKAIDKERVTVNRWENSEKIPKGAQKLLQMFFGNDTHNVNTSTKSDINSSKKLQVEDLVINDPLVLYNTKAGSVFEELSDGTYMMRVPFVPVQAQASYVSEQIDPEELNQYKSQTFRVGQKGNGRYLAWQIKNDSMDDGSEYGIKDGDIKLTREVGQHLWKSRLRYNHFPFWIIVTNEDVICKEIINHDVERGIITCHSLNPTYEDFDLHLNDVRQLFNVIPTLED